ncbi:hypothetical protein BRD00_11545 [Halobacteriales archaeon QS_8_69_26]|nr:MAG: hypothetical protein BRD00_11545 [Halobacteriales archaeon QS_8_69_26]
MSSEPHEEGLADYLRVAVRGILGDPDLRTLYAVYLLLFVVAELYRQALPLYFRALGIPIAVLGLGKSVATALEVLASPAFGVAADEYDRFAMAAVAGLVLAGAFALLGVAATPAALVALMALIAVTRLALNNAATPAVDEALDGEFAGIGWGIRDVSIYGGAALGLALGGVVSSVLPSVRFAFFALVPVLLLTTALLWRNRDGVDREGSGDGETGGAGDDAPEGSESGAAEGSDDGTPGGSGSNEAEGPGDGEADDREGSSPGGDRSPLDRVRSGLRPSVPDLPNPPVLARFLAITLLSNGGMGMTVFLLPVLAVDLGIGAGEFLFLFSGSFAVSAPLSVLGGVAADRFDRKYLYVGNFLAETLMLAAFAVASSVPLFVVGTALYVVQTTFEPAVATFFFDSFDEDVAGTAWGITGTASKAAGVAAPVGGAVLYELDPAFAFAAGAVLLAGATLVALTLPRP